MGLPEALDHVEMWWSAHGYRVIIATMLTTAVVLVGTLIAARRRGRVDRWVSTVAGVAVLGLSAEGMWVVAIDLLNLPPVFAIVVFAVFELAMLSSAMQATAQYRRTTVRDANGVLVTPGHPGRHGAAVWAIAAGAGIIVSLNSQSFVEVLLRLALPILAASMWWNTLTAEGTTRPQGTWRWTPRRLLVRLGAVEPNERDLADITRDRRIAAMTATARRVHRGSRPRAWHLARLERFALTADPAMIQEVQSRVERAHRVRELTAPSGHTSNGHTSAAPSGHTSNGHTSNGHTSAAPSGHTSNGHTSAAPSSSGGSSSSPMSPEGRRLAMNDEELLATFGDQLVTERLATGRLTEYRIRQVCNVSARPSRRIKERIEQLVQERSAVAEQFPQAPERNSPQELRGFPQVSQLPSEHSGQRLRPGHPSPDADQDHPQAVTESHLGISIE